jgi:site-specific recombinase XerD
MIYLNEYAIYLKTDRNSADNTIAAYLGDIKQFFEFEGTPESVTLITSNHIRQYIAKLMKDKKEVSSINRMKIALKGFFKYLVTIARVVQESPAEEIKTTKTDSSLPKYIAQVDVQSILQAATESSTKDRLQIELLYGSGGRVSEVASLKIEDIDFTDSFISLFGKGSKERNNPIHESCIILIKRYMNETGITSGYLFPLKGDSSRHATREGIGKAVKRVAVKAGIDPKKISPHVFRHSFATHMLDNGCDMSHVQELLGHEDIATTRIYAKITKTNKKSNYAKFHPLANSTTL